MEAVFYVTNIDNYFENLSAFIPENSDYFKSKSYLADHYTSGDCIFKYDVCELSPVKLVEEPDNPDHPNGIRVDVSGKTVGYIDSVSTGKVRRLMSDPTAAITASFSGGPYKELYIDETDKINTEKSDFPYEIELKITTGVVQKPAQQSDAKSAAGTPEAPPISGPSPIIYWFFAILLAGIGIYVHGIVFKIICFLFTAILSYGGVLALKTRKAEKEARKAYKEAKKAKKAKAKAKAKKKKK